MSLRRQSARAAAGLGPGAGTRTLSFPSRVTAITTPSAAKMVAAAKAAWKPLVSAVSGLLPCAWERATVERIARAEGEENAPAAGPPDLNRRVREPGGEPGVCVGDAGQRDDRAGDVGGPEPG